MKEKQSTSGYVLKSNVAVASPTSAASGPSDRGLSSSDTSPSPPPSVKPPPPATSSGSGSAMVMSVSMNGPIMIPRLNLNLEHDMDVTDLLSPPPVHASLVVSSGDSESQKQQQQGPPPAHQQQQQLQPSQQQPPHQQPLHHVHHAHEHALPALLESRPMVDGEFAALPQILESEVLAATAVAHRPSDDSTAPGGEQRYRRMESLNTHVEERRITHAVSVAGNSDTSEEEPVLDAPDNKFEVKRNSESGKGTCPLLVEPHVRITKLLRCFFVANLFSCVCILHHGL